MGVSKKQREKVERTCECGCGEIFYPFPVYGKKGEGLIYPKYKRGHHPRCQKGQFSDKPWNKGLTKNDHPSMARMGFQPGHEPYNDWSHVNELLKNDPETRIRWIESKKGQVAWNKGKTKAEYANGIKHGPEHGNWCGGKRGIFSLCEMRNFKCSIIKRDDYTCQHCGDRNHAGRGSRIRLEVHHIVAIAEDPSLAFDPSNVITLCAPCHRKTDNFGTKVVHKLKRQGRYIS